MSLTITDEEREEAAERLDTVFESRPADLRDLASHAALPVALDAELLCLIRQNFVNQIGAPPLVAEADLLLSPICREAGDGLYEMLPELRLVLIEELRARYGDTRTASVASLLWQYGAKTINPWRTESLHRAQQITALSFLDADAANRWIDQSESAATDDATKAWYVALRRKLIQPVVPSPPNHLPRLFRIFVSGSMGTLQRERNTVRAELLKQFYGKIELSGFEEHESRPEGNDDEAAARNSDLYIGIFANRYGSGRSEREYRAARLANVPCLIYIYRNSDPKKQTPARLSRRDTDESKHRLLDALKWRLQRDHLVKFFANENQLATMAVSDATEWVVKGGERIVPETANWEIPPGDLSTVRQLLAAVFGGKPEERAGLLSLALYGSPILVLDSSEVR